MNTAKDQGFEAELQAAAAARGATVHLCGAGHYQ